MIKSINLVTKCDSNSTASTSRVVALPALFCREDAVLALRFRGGTKLAAVRRALTWLYALTLCSVGLVEPRYAFGESAAFSMHVEEFCRLPDADQKALVKSAFDLRLRLAKNIHYEALLRGHVHKYHDGRIGDLVADLNGRRYRHWRLGDSYRIDSDKGGVDVSKPDEFGISGFDSLAGVRKSTVRSEGTPRLFARIDVTHNVDIHENRYAYWLDGTPDKRSQADFLIRYVADNSDSYKFEAPVNQDKVRLIIPWQPHWSKKPLGTRTLELDPTKGFLPVRGKAYWEEQLPKRGPWWRSEEFSVEASTLVRDVWMPTKLRESVRASSTGPDRVAVWETEITKIEADTVSPNDLVVPWPEGTEVVDAIKGVAYVIGPDGEHLRERHLVGGKSLTPAELSKLAMSQQKRMAQSNIWGIALINLGIVVVVGGLILRRSYTSNKGKTPAGEVTLSSE
jgi:hypothetical protein